jgi:hypothetical protein
LLADFWTDPTHTQPPLAALMAGEFLVISGEGAVYGEREASDRLTQTAAGRGAQTPSQADQRPSPKPHHKRSTHPSRA